MRAPLLCAILAACGCSGHAAERRGEDGGSKVRIDTEPPDHGTAAGANPVQARGAAHESGGVAAIALEPDDEEFYRKTVSPAGVPGSSDERAPQGTETGGATFTIKGVVKSVDPQSGILVIEQLLVSGDKHEVRFWTDSMTKVGWSKVSTKTTLADLWPGMGLYVTYRIVKREGVSCNQAVKVIIPGGMEDVTKMILGTAAKQ